MAALSSGCSNDSEEVQDEARLVFLTNKPHAAVARNFEMNSQAGCALDSDCAVGMFCFHGLCTSECSEKNPCAAGTCSENGRCIVSKSKNSLRDLKDDLEESQKSDVVEQVPGAEVLFEPDEKIWVNPGASSSIVTVTTKEDYGTVSYTVSKAVDDTVSSLMQSEPIVDEKTGKAVYSFVVPAQESSLGEKGANENVVLDTSIGAFELTLMPRKPATGLYEGTVRAEQFAGVGLPIRFIIETTPAKITSFEDIKGLTIYLPSSGADLFSPEIVTDASKTTWSKIEMTQENASNCMNADKCWSANYSTNDFTFQSSELVNADQKVNRAIRIEIAGFDGKDMVFDGNMRDILAGVYREVDGTGKMQWAKASMNGTFVATRKDAFHKDDIEIVDHQKQKEELRDLSKPAADICTDVDIKSLMETAGEGCGDIETLQGYKDSENGQACLLAAARTMLSSDKLVSKIIEKLITKEANDPEPVAGFATLQDFMTDCAKDDGICAENHAIVCAVDLLGRSYLTSDETNKVEILESWHQLMRESYLGRQYSAWQNDVEVRRKWLENSTSPTFLSAILEKINTDMLAEWETKVFAAHRNVLAKQFNQTSLEVLTRVDSNSAIVSNRDLILGEFSDGWSGVSDSMALGLRRYDTLYQGTAQRMGKAAEMRPHLFDLYYSGLVETAINRATGNSSLNASYGKNLYENVARVRSLNQSFDDLVFMRDAEIVTSTSLDPLSGNAQVLSERKKLAKETVAAAQERRDKVFEEYDTKTINKAQINATLTNTIDSLKTELVSLCGLPRGCTSAESEDCLPRAIPGFCGFDIPADSDVPGGLGYDLATNVLSTADINQYYSSKSYKLDTANLQLLTEKDIRAMSEANRNELLGLTEDDFKTSNGESKSESEIKSIVDQSIEAYLAAQDAQIRYTVTDYYSLTNSGEAAEAIIAYRSALKDVDIAQADFMALYNKVAIARSTCDTYADNIDKWNAGRLELLETLQRNIEVINSHYDNITQAERDKINADLKLMQDEYDKQKKYVDKWKSISTTYKNEQISRIETIQHVTNASMSLEFSSGVVERGVEALTAYAEDPVDSDRILGVMSANGLYKGIVTTVGMVAIDAMEAVKLGMDIKANNRQATMDIKSYEYEFDTQLNELNHCCPTKMWRYSWFGTDFLLKGNSAKPPFARSSEPWRSITQFFTH
ncbi:MAG: hypothetical protein IJ165_01775 [Proteobacteria bacterium]|nr:hypothetical protein [Pseudomonadota bacterium]